MVEQSKASAGPLITVVIPTYNYGHYLRRALDSVLQQGTNVELVVVNDGSVDDTREVLEEYQRRYADLTVLNQVNSGAATARNNGVAQANGKYILLLDADDALIPGSLDLLRKSIFAHPDAGILIGGRIAVYPDGRERIWIPRQVSSSSPLDKIRDYLFSKKIEIGNGRTLIRRELLIERPYPIGLNKGEDIPVFAYALAMAPCAFIKKPLVKVYKHADSLRNTRADEEQNAMRLVDEVFYNLPLECQSAKAKYKVALYLSLFRDALNAKDYRQANIFYKKSLSLDFLQALKWRYFRKFIRMIFRA